MHGHGSERGRGSGARPPCGNGSGHARGAAQPTAAVIASQSVKTTSVGGARGYDGAKQLRGRKRHLLVGTLGLVLKAKVHAADLQDRAAVPQMLDKIQEDCPQVGHVWADRGYTGSGKTWIETALGWTVEIVRHPPPARGEWRPIGDVNDLATLRFAWVRIPPAPQAVPGRTPETVGRGAHVQ